MAWLAHESCSITGEMLASMAGRIAMAYIAETRGVYRPTWTIEEVAAQMEAIRARDDYVSFPVVPTGQGGHIGYSFAMAKQG